MSSNKVIKNASWIIAGKIVQSLIGLIISMLTARYLGPSNYGTINYAVAIVSFMAPILRLGIDNILVRELIEDKNKEGTVMGSAILLNLISSFLCIIGIIAFVSIMNRGDTETIIVCSLYSIQLIFQSFELLRFWFQAKLLSKYTTIVSLIGYLVVTAYRIFLLATQKNVYWFALSYSVENLVLAVLQLVFYRRYSDQPLQFSKEVSIRLLNAGKYYIISDLMVNIFAQTDKIMLKNIISSDATAYYSAALTCASMTGFVFTAILDSYRPIIFESKKDNESRFELNLIRLFAIIIYLSLLQSIVMTIFANLIIKILFGADYMPAVSALRIVVWYTTFAYVGSIRNMWILSEGKQKYLLPINGMGALLNIILNFIFISRYGANGAAVASLITQIFTNVITGMIIAEIRPVNRYMFQSLNPKYILNTISTVWNEMKHR